MKRCARLRSEAHLCVCVCACYCRPPTPTPPVLLPLHLRRLSAHGKGKRKSVIISPLSLSPLMHHLPVPPLPSLPPRLVPFTLPLPLSHTHTRTYATSEERHACKRLRAPPSPYSTHTHTQRKTPTRGSARNRETSANRKHKETVVVIPQTLWSTSSACGVENLKMKMMMIRGGKNEEESMRPQRKQVPDAQLTEKEKERGQTEPLGSTIKQQGNTKERKSECTFEESRKQRRKLRGRGGGGLQREQMCPASGKSHNTLAQTRRGEIGEDTPYRREVFTAGAAATAVGGGGGVCVAFLFSILCPSPLTLWDRTLHTRRENKPLLAPSAKHVCVCLCTSLLLADVSPRAKTPGATRHRIAERCVTMYARADKSATGSHAIGTRKQRHQVEAARRASESSPRACQNDSEADQ